MSVEQNKAILKRMYDEGWNKGNWSIVSEVISPDYQRGEYKGQDGWKQLVSTTRLAFPDIHEKIEQVVGEGDWLAYRISVRGTSRGKFANMEPTGKEIKWTQMLFSQFKDGKLMKTETLADTINIYKQQGIIPPGFKQTEEKNKEVIRRTMDEIWSKGNLSLIPELFSSDYTSYNSSGKNILGHEGFRKMVEAARTGYPDLLCTIDQLVAEGDTVVCRYILTGTHKGEYLGVAPTGKKVSVLCLFLTVMRDGKSAETWALNETLASYRQLGIAPPGYELAKEKQPV